MKNIKYKWRILYKPPLEEMVDDDPDTWRKTFFISVYECPTELDLTCKINQLVADYKMDKKYIILEDLEDIND